MKISLWARTTICGALLLAGCAGSKPHAHTGHWRLLSEQGALISPPSAHGASATLLALARKNAEGVDQWWLPDGTPLAQAPVEMTWKPPLSVPGDEPMNDAYDSHYTLLLMKVKNPTLKGPITACGFCVGVEPEGSPWYLAMQEYAAENDEALEAVSIGTPRTLKALTFSYSTPSGDFETQDVPIDGLAKQFRGTDNAERVRILKERPSITWPRKIGGETVFALAGNSPAAIQAVDASGRRERVEAYSSANGMGKPVSLWKVPAGVAKNLDRLEFVHAKMMTAHFSDVSLEPNLNTTPTVAKTE
ncbi:hypothetical protein BH09SUM1_BH09SUM1_22840 [soil metagenome]